MRVAAACLLTLAVALVSASSARAQAGRYVPLPRILPPGGGGGGFFPHVPFHVPVRAGQGQDGGGQGDGDYVVLAILAALLLVLLGWYVGRAVGRRLRPAAEMPKSPRPPGPTAWQTTAPPMQDLILQPHEVAAKAEQTRRLLLFLACRDHALDPGELHRRITTTFVLVQKAWEARDYGPVRHLLLPNILAKHETLLKSMRSNHEINRIEGLRVERLELVHLHCPGCVDDQEVTALITFRASVYFVHDRTGAHTRGLRSPSWFQELWTFRRRENGWLLQGIEQSHESDRPERPNFAADLTDWQSANAQSSIAL
jgi:predicted lipid-binding transport protein (Tim44 family)